MTQSHLIRICATVVHLADHPSGLIRTRSVCGRGRMATTPPSGQTLTF